jgi:mannose/fructose-specific phosphotransferase system component IIA
MTRSDGQARPVRGIIVGPGDLPEALLGAAAAIVGRAEGITTLSNQGLSAAELEQRLDRLAEADPGAAVVVFVDMFGSSCSTVSLKVHRSRPNLAVVCGVNLPMLLRFISHRDRDDFPQLVQEIRRAQANGPGAAGPAEAGR